MPTNQFESSGSSLPQEPANPNNPGSSTLSGLTHENQRDAEAFAPAKLILLGEHAAVYGYPALGIGLSTGVRAHLRRVDAKTDVKGSVELFILGETSVPSESLLALITDLTRDVHVATTLGVGVPASSGLGSSAALATALLRAVDRLEGRHRSKRDAHRIVTRAEAHVHGRSSGLDPALSGFGGLLSFRKKRDSFSIRRIKAKRPFWLAIGVHGSHGGTQRSVQRVANLRTIAPKLARSALETLGAAALAGRRALEAGDLKTFGACADMAHGTLSGFGLVSDALEASVRAARAAGALGAKVSGAGGSGGALFGVAASQESADQIATALQSSGAHPVWIETCGL